MRLRLNRPQAANALNRAMLAGIQAALVAAREDGGVGAVLLCSTGRAFCGGMDLNEAFDPVAAFSQQMRREMLSATLAAMAEFPKPLVVAVQGPAVGAGCMLAFMADVLVADEAARFSLPEVALGMPTPIAATIAEWRGGASLARHLVLGNGTSTAADMRVGAISSDTGASLDYFAAVRTAALARQPAHAFGPTKAWLARSIVQQLEVATAEAKRIAERTM
nr:enoyl-CoA hydratase/isomerase family protein [Variovorax sp. PBL-H6]